MNSGDASETIKVVESFFGKNIYCSYIMYKGIYAFLPGIACYFLSKITGVSMYFFWKILKSLAFAYLATIGVPFLFEKIFKNPVKVWQKYLFAIVLFILERCVFYLISVDLTSCLFLVLALNQTIKLSEKYSHKLCFITGLIFGIETGLSGQFSISVYILIIYLLIQLIKKTRKNLKKMGLVVIIFALGFCITKSADIAFEKLVVNNFRENGEWLPTKSDWFNHGLSFHMTFITYPANLEDKLSLAIAKNDNEDYYNFIVNGSDIYTLRHYVKMIIKHPVSFVIRWTERLFLGLVNDPINSFGIKSGPIYFVVSFMGVCLYSLIYYLKKYTKKLKDLLSFPAFVLYSVLFSAFVPSFGHVENRYYFSARVILIGVLLLSPLLPNYLKKFKDKKVKFTNINMDFITCLIFVIICLVAYCALYQNMSDIILQNNF
ncbi:MAG: hypothetical protein IKN63_01105 [Bacilli bacterium]|nr:hypothetical protein [Bacilli bacterium]